MFTTNPTKGSHSQYDAVVVGARCAGAATALLLARRGLKVLMVDRGGYGSDTTSTHALMRGGVTQLQRWGVLDAVIAAGTPVVRAATFHYGDETIAVPVKPHRGAEGLYAPRRTVLDRILVDAARKAGAQVRFGCTLTGLLHHRSGRVRGVLLQDAEHGRREVTAQIVIGADGIGSAVARWAGAGTYRSAVHAGAVLYGYARNLGVDGYHWHYRPGVSAGTIPTNDGQYCVFAACPPQRFYGEIRQDLAAGFHRLLAQADPTLADQVAAAPLVGRLRGFVGVKGYFRHSHGPGWALVGDAGYFKDPITAHGMTDALRDAELLARAVVTGTDPALHAYQLQRDAVSLDLFRITDAVASYDWDMETLKAHHLALNQAMKAENALFDDAPEHRADRRPAEAASYEAVPAVV